MSRAICCGEAYRRCPVSQVVAVAVDLVADSGHASTDWQMASELTRAVCVQGHIMRRKNSAVVRRSENRELQQLLSVEP